MFKAVAILMPGDEQSPSGIIKFFQSDVRSPVIIKGNLKNLRPGKHGFNIHTLGDLANGCASTGPHYNPNNQSHGGPKDAERHVGDLGNILANEDGTARILITDEYISLVGSCSIIGRSVVIHAKPDDLGKGENDESLNTGNAGARIACGVIGRA